MTTVPWRIAGLVVTLSLAHAVTGTAQEANASTALRLPIAGSFAGGGEFNGTVSINKFERRGDHIVAVGFVSGVLMRHRRVGTAVAGQLEWPVVIRSGGQVFVSGQAPAAPRPMTIAWSPAPQPAPKILLAQQSCPVATLALAPMTVNLLGIQVALGPVNLDLSGESGPLGVLVCELSTLLGNVAGLVGVLNGILGLLTGLLGGLTGGGLPPL